MLKVTTRTLVLVVLVMFQMHVIINGVAYPENGDDEGDQGGARRVLASEEAALETIQAWCSIAFWKFGVEVD